MNFIHKKIEENKKNLLRGFFWEDIVPYQLLPTPLYYYLPKNGKYIAIKGPLEFVSQSEKEKMKGMKTFFLTNYIEQLEPIKQLAQELKNELTRQHVLPLEPKRKFSEVELSEPSYIQSKEVLKKVSRLWNSDLTIEPYFVIIFCEYFLGSMPPEILEAAFEKNTDLFDKALIYSCLGVFLLLHYGVCDYAYLREMREVLFQYSMGELKVERSDTGIELYEFIQQLDKVCPTHNTMLVSDELFLNHSTRFAKKLVSRLVYRAEHFIDSDRKRWSLLEGEGFLNEKI